VLMEFKPDLPESYRAAEYLFLANIDPDLQMEVLEQMHKPKLVACDTMNFWISSKPEALRRVLQKVDIVVINEGEARQFTGEPNLVKAARQIIALGCKRLVVKRGEYGVLMFTADSVFAAPAYRWRRYLTRPAQETPLPAVSWAIWPIPATFPKRASARRSYSAR